MKKLPAEGAFSLVEVTLALGIAAFCLIAVFGFGAGRGADEPQRHFPDCCY